MKFNGTQVRPGTLTASKAEKLIGAVVNRIDIYRQESNHGTNEATLFEIELMDVDGSILVVRPLTMELEDDYATQLIVVRRNRGSYERQSKT